MCGDADLPPPLLVVSAVFADWWKHCRGPAPEYEKQQSTLPFQCTQPQSFVVPVIHLKRVGVLGNRT